MARPSLIKRDRRVAAVAAAISAAIPDLVERADARFDIQRVSADKAYSSRINLSTVENLGAKSFIPFKSNVRASALGNDVWGRAYYYFMFNREEFLKFYHARSNVETTFSMVKAKFGTKLRSKTATAQTNEVLCKLLCHNLCCLVHATFELGIEATFWQGTVA
jgi:transposase